MRTAADDATVSASDCNAQNLPWPNGGHQRFTCVWLSALLRPLTCPRARLAGRDLRGLTSSISAWRLSSTLESLRMGWRRAICPLIAPWLPPSSRCDVRLWLEAGRLMPFLSRAAAQHGGIRRSVLLFVRRAVCLAMLTSSSSRRYTLASRLDSLHHHYCCSSRPMGMPVRLCFLFLFAHSLSGNVPGRAPAGLMTIAFMCQGRALFR